MKKVIAVLFAVGMLVCLVSCGDQRTEDVSVPVESPTPQAAETIPAPVPSAASLTIELAAPELPELEQPKAEESQPELEQPEAEAAPTVEESVPAQSHAPSAPAHVHDWQPVTQTVHHEAVTEQRKVVDVSAVEGHYEGGSYEVMVCRCGKVFTSGDSWLAHSYAGGIEEHGGFSTDIRSNQVWVEGTPEVSHYETVVISEAWDEEIITGMVCTSCGAVG